MLDYLKKKIETKSIKNNKKKNAFLPKWNLKMQEQC